MDRDFGDERTDATEGTMIQPSVYSEFGQVTGTPSRPEPTEAERAAARQANEYTADDIFAWLGLTSNDIAVATAKFGFPKNFLRSRSVWTWSGRQRRDEMVWLRSEVEAWLTDITTFVTGLKKK